MQQSPLLNLPFHLLNGLYCVRYTDRNNYPWGYSFSLFVEYNLMFDLLPSSNLVSSCHAIWTWWVTEWFCVTTWTLIIFFVCFACLFTCMYVCKCTHMKEKCICAFCLLSVFFHSLTAWNDQQLYATTSHEVVWYITGCRRHVLFNQIITNRM